MMADSGEKKLSYWALIVLHDLVLGGLDACLAVVGVPGLVRR
jgi:hypothetical protein